MTADSLGLPGAGDWMRDIILSAKSWFAWTWAAVLLATYRLVIWSVLCPMSWERTAWLVLPSDCAVPFLAERLQADIPHGGMEVSSKLLMAGLAIDGYMCFAVAGKEAAKVFFVFWGVSAPSFCHKCQHATRTMPHANFEIGSIQTSIFKLILSFIRIFSNC